MQLPPSLSLAMPDQHHQPSRSQEPRHLQQNHRPQRSDEVALVPSFAEGALRPAQQRRQEEPRERAVGGSEGAQPKRGWSEANTEELRELLVSQWKAGVSQSSNGFWEAIIRSSSTLHTFRPDSVRNGWLLLSLPLLHGQGRIGKEGKSRRNQKKGEER